MVTMMTTMFQTQRSRQRSSFLVKDWVHYWIPPRQRCRRTLEDRQDPIFRVLPFSTWTAVSKKRAAHDTIPYGCDNNYAGSLSRPKLPPTNDDDCARRRSLPPPPKHEQPLPWLVRQVPAVPCSAIRLGQDESLRSTFPFNVQRRTPPPQRQRAYTTLTRTLATTTTEADLWKETRPPASAAATSTTTTIVADDAETTTPGPRSEGHDNDDDDNDDETNQQRLRQRLEELLRQRHALRREIDDDGPAHDCGRHESCDRTGSRSIVDRVRIQKMTALAVLLRELVDCSAALGQWQTALDWEEQRETILGSWLPVTADVDHDDADDVLVMQADSLCRQGNLHVRMQPPRQKQPLARLSQTSTTTTTTTTTTETEKANQLYHTALKLLRSKYDTHPSIGHVLMAQARLSIHQQQQQWETALSLLQQAEHHLSGCPTQQWGLAECLQQQGMLYRAMSDYTTALQSYERATQLLQREQDQKQSQGPPVNRDQTLSYSKNNDRKTLKGLTLDRADMHAALGQLEPAFQLYQSLLNDLSNNDKDNSKKSASKESEKEATMAVLWHNMGKIRAQECEYELAIEFLQRSVAIKRRLSGVSHWNNPEIAKTLNILGAVYTVTNRQTEALQCFQESLLIARATSDGPVENDPHVQIALRNIARLRNPKDSSGGEQSRSDVSKNTKDKKK